jgi:hypothetical protein
MAHVFMPQAVSSNLFASSTPWGSFLPGGRSLSVTIF